MTKHLKPYQAAIFDLDGTLIDSRADIAAALNWARTQAGLEALSLATILPMIGHGLPSLVQKGFADSDMDDQAQVPVAMEYYKAHPSDLSVVFPGVIETLQQLSLPMAIVSNKPTELIAPVLESTGLASFFELQFGGESFPHRKPHPIAAQHCLEHWGLSPKDVLMVGDMQPDADFAKNAGMNFAYCSYGYSDQTIECDHLLETFPACQKLFPASSP